MASTTIDDFHAALAPEDRAICDRLRDLIDETLPEAEAKIWHAHPLWFLKGNPIVGYSKLKGAVRCLFWSGQSFATRGLAGSGTFKAAEVRFGAAEDVEENIFRCWVSEARDIQWDYRNIVKRIGRLEPLKGLG